MKTLILCAVVSTLFSIELVASTRASVKSNDAAAASSGLHYNPEGAVGFECAQTYASEPKMVLLATGKPTSNGAATDATEAQTIQECVKVMVCRCRVVYNPDGTIATVIPVAIESSYDIAGVSDILRFGAFYNIPVSELSFTDAAKLTALGLWAHCRVLGATLIGLGNFLGPRIIAATPTVEKILCGAASIVGRGVQGVVKKVTGGGDGRRTS